MRNGSKAALITVWPKTSQLRRLLNCQLIILLKSTAQDRDVVGVRVFRGAARVEAGYVAQDVGVQVGERQMTAQAQALDHPLFAELVFLLVENIRQPIGVAEQHGAGWHRLPPFGQERERFHHAEHQGAVTQRFYGVGVGQS